MIATLESVTDICRRMAWSWTLEYSEIENTYYATARGIGKGEYVEVKRCSDPEAALQRLLEKILAWRAPAPV